EELLEREQLGAMTHLLDSLRPAASVDRDLGLFVACMDAELLRFKGHALERFALLDSVAPAFDHTPDRWKVLFLLGRARAFKDLSLNDEALKDAGQALSLARQRGEKKLLARSMIVKAEIERRMGQYDDMLADLIDAEKLCDTIGYERGKCNVLINWGTMLFGQQRYAEAFDKYKACFEHAMAHRFPSIARNAVLNIGAAAFQLQDFPKAIAVYEEALERNKQLGDRDFEAAVLSNMAVVYNGMKRYDLARTYLERAMGIVRELGDTSAQVYNYNYLATSYWELGLRDSALAATAVTISLSHASHSLELESAGEEKMYDYLKRSGREKEALTHLERHLALKDSLDAVKEGELIHRLEIGYGTEKKERTIQLRDLQLEQERARNRARVVQRNILLGTLVALCIVAFLTYRNISHKRAIAEQQKRISEQRIEQVLTEQELRLVSATMEGQDKERQRVAKDLHDRVGSLLSGVKLQFSALEERMSKLVANGPEHFKKVLDLLDTAVGEVRRISHDLLSSNLAAFGLNSALSDLCDAVHVPGKMDVELSLFGVEERMAKNVEVAAYRIVQEVVSNALKHASATTLSIQVTRVDRQLNILVEDNGRGFDPATARQGMGTGNLHARAAELGGTVHIDSRLGRGTSVSVDIPLG
ncbi:MAG TPA: sensor histidine kinase, partial [Flavobacteriales bacterium]|nr:sensor histidine kinase [Flavobacteriales bacterium]